MVGRVTGTSPGWKKTSRSAWHSHWVWSTHASWGTLLDPFMPVTLHFTGGLLVPPEVSYLQLHEFHCCLFYLLNLVFVFRKDIQLFLYVKNKTRQQEKQQGTGPAPLQLLTNHPAKKLGILNGCYLSHFVPHLPKAVKSEQGFSGVTPVPLWHRVRTQRLGSTSNHDLASWTLPLVTLPIRAGWPCKMWLCKVASPLDVWVRYLIIWG